MLEEHDLLFAERCDGLVLAIQTGAVVPLLYVVLVGEKLHPAGHPPLPQRFSWGLRVCVEDDAMFAHIVLSRFFHCNPPVPPCLLRSIVRTNPHVILEKT